MNDQVRTEVTPHSSHGEREYVKNAEQSGDLSDNRDKLDVKCDDDGQSEQVNDQPEERQQLERETTPCKQECHEFSVEESTTQQVKPCDQKDDNHGSSGEEVSSLITPDEEEERKSEKKSESDHSEYYALKRESRRQSEDAVELQLFLIGILLGSTWPY